MPHDISRFRSDCVAELESLNAVAASAEVRSRRAFLLDRLGRTEEARACYLEALRDAPDHEAALNGLGALLHRTGYRSAARTVFTRSVACHPGSPTGRVHLANVLREAGAHDEARAHFLAALAAWPDQAQAHQGLGDILAERGDWEGAARHWRLGYRDHAIHRWTYRGERNPVRVLMPISVANGNIAARAFLDDRVFDVTTIAMEFCDAAAALPPHDVVLNAIGDADLCGDALRAAAALIARSVAPVINHPRRVLATGRESTMERLRGMPGLVVPRAKTMAMADLLGADGPAQLEQAGFSYPVLLRAPGYHTGRHFLRVGRADELAEKAALLPGEHVLVIEYVDTDGAGGEWRKGRVMVIGGALFPLHWAVSSQWKVHYFSSDMAANAAPRAEEGSFLADMGGFLGASATAALVGAASRLGLDYGGVDFGIARDGRVAVFEANAAMAIVPPPPGDIWAYRRPACTAALLAVQSMLIRRSGVTAAG